MARIGTILGEPGERLLLMGNEAIARGVLEADAAVASTYPGTPSSEILMVLSEVAPKVGLYAEYSTNEKVAFEVALAASWNGLRSVVTMKHVGLNVAADSFMSAAYQGTKGGMVVVTADDPSMWSSQNEQDNRMYAMFANVPVLDPMDPQEALEMTKYAFQLSEEVGSLVMLRPTTRVSHTRADVKIGDLPENKKNAVRLWGHFEKNPEKYVVLPSRARRMHPEVLERIEKAREILENAPFNWEEGSGEIGIIVSGISYVYLKEALHKLGIEDKVSILKIGTPFPLPLKKVESFLRKFEGGKVLVIEELEPIVENQIKVLVYDKGINVEIHGKDYIPRIYEMTTRRIIEALEKYLGMKHDVDFAAIDEHFKKVSEKLPPRPPTLCPACPHRNTFYAIKRNAKGKGIYTGDIGCYSLGALKPLETMDTIVSMGASIGLGTGMAHAQKDKRVYAIIGDSTFFHTGLSALANAVYNKAPMTVVVLDNRITAMTGHQPDPSTGLTATMEPTKFIDIAEIAKAMGADYVAVVDSYDIPELLKVLEEADKHQVSVVVSRQPCSLLRTRIQRKKGESWPLYQVDPDKCTGCKVCINAHGCPAISFDKEKNVAVIDEVMCWGCSGCAQVCPFDAIYEKLPDGGRKYDVLDEENKRRWQQWNSML
ncbi:indolepyruvate ferredoxin oxidoreductase subunit alpha [bacterium 3DAC]|nr:indolepyruvate ferredoxin oxidoreductase subunit alpha [bacterium 3DAC]